MTVSTDVLLVVLVVLAGLIALALAAFAGHGCWRALRDRRLRVPLAALHAAAAELAAGAPLDDALRAAVRRAPRREQLELLAQLLPSVGGEAAAALRAAVDREPLLAGARRRCRSRRWRTRLHGVRTLALLGAGETIVPPLLGDPRPEVRAAAAEWAADHPADAVIERLVALLRAADPFVRFTAMDALVRLGARAVPLLAEAIADGAGAATLEVAARVADPRLRAPARGRLADPDPAVRAWAGRVLGALGDADDAAATVALLDDPDAEVRAAAAVALGRLGHWPAAAALGARLRDPAWRVRRDAAHALLRLGAAGRLTLERATRDGDAYARDMARQALELPAGSLPA